ncbi:MAG: DUF4838 domain-containing protein, partial [Candidatus Glassbacteria bacterium]|nr:DUF4838 domain-containing protein [Candidatus Glassbacteria bacterium]
GRPKCSIVVDCGSFADPWDAVAGEEEVNWGDPLSAEAVACTEAFAAVEMRKYLCRMAGLDTTDINILPIWNFRESLPDAENVIVVGQACSRGEYARLEQKIPSDSDDAFLIRSGKIDAKNIIIIKGKTRSGTLYGVYHLLNLLGCRWYAPGSGGEIIPRKKIIALGDLNIEEAPAVDIRGFWISHGKVEAEVNNMTWEGSLTDRGNTEFFSWMARNRLNFFWNKEKDWKLMKKLGIHLTCGEHITYYELLRPDKPYPYNHPGFKISGSLPADPYPVSPEYTGDINRDGILSYSEAHPEWYGMTSDGKRYFPQSVFGVNYCSSSKSGFDELLKNIITYLREGDGNNADIISLWPLDGGEWCCCPLCKAQGANDTDKLLDLVYNVRKGLRQAYLEGKLDRDIPVHSLIYVQTEALPSRELPEDFDYKNIVLTYFPIDRCYAHNFDDPLCTEVNSKYFDVLKKWRSKDCKYKGRLLLGEYYNISGFRDLPLVFKKTMANDIPLFIHSGISGFHYMHTSVADMGVRRLINYQMAQMLWNPDTPPEILWDNYFRDLYGPVSSEMAAFYDMLESTVANVKAWRYYLRPRMNEVALGKAESVFAIPVMPKHLHYQTYHPETDDGLDWQEMMLQLGQCRDAIDNVLAQKLPLEIRARIEEDEYGFQYLENSLNLFDSLLSLMLQPALPEADKKEAFAKAGKSAEFLKQYRIKSPALGVKNAFEATDLGQAYYRLVGIYGE